MNQSYIGTGEEISNEIETICHELGLKNLSKDEESKIIMDRFIAYKTIVACLASEDIDGFDKTTLNFAKALSKHIKTKDEN